MHIPGMISLSEAISRALDTSPDSVAVTAVLRTSRQAFAITVFSVDKQELIAFEVDGLSGTVSQVARVLSADHTGDVVV